MILLLRFRDLSTPVPGTTIKEHQRIVDKPGSGYVWWAWWKKQSEEVPAELWISLNRQIKSDGPLTVFLVDSGQRHLYRTSLNKIDFGTAADLIDAPEKGEKTPAYYREEPFASWFKLGPIERVPDEETENTLQDLAYERVPHDDVVVVDPAHFIGHRVEGINQLLEFGNVTYWVAAKAPDDVATAQSPLRRLSPAVVAPNPIIQSSYSRILHISDLHIGAGQHSFALDEGTGDQLTLASALHQVLQENLPGLVVVSGDLTWTGAEDEFDAAFGVLDKLRAVLGLRPEDFVIIPGNHDIQWSTAQRDRDEYDNEGTVSLASDDAKRNYSRFFKRWYQRPANEHLSIGRRFFLPGGPTLDVLGFNSSELQQVEGCFAGIGRITDAALEETAKEMRWETARATQIRAMVTHHHVLPVISRMNPNEAGSGFGMAIDAESQLVKAAEWNVDLVMHGHQHQPYIGTVRREQIAGDPIGGDRPTVVVGAGSAGVSRAHLGPIRYNSFNLLSLTQDRMHLGLFGTPNDPHRFEKISQASIAWGKNNWARSD